MSILNIVSADTKSAILNELYMYETGISTEFSTLISRFEELQGNIVMVDYVISHYVPKVLFIFSNLEFLVEANQFQSYVEFFEVNTPETAIDDFSKNKKCITPDDDRYMLLVLEARRILNFKSYMLCNFIEEFSKLNTVFITDLYNSVAELYNYSSDFMHIKYAKELYNAINIISNKVTN